MKDTAQPHGNALATKLAVIQAYDLRGWCLTSCRARGKEPNRTNWHNERLNLEQITNLIADDPSQNIGMVLGKSSEGVICVDLDNSIAVELADQFLPPTPLVVGRGRNPRTHWFYRVPAGIKPTKFKLPNDPSDPTKKLTVVEILSDGNQVVVGPSIHPDDDQYDVLETEPATVDADELLEAAQSLFHAVLDRLGLIEKVVPKAATNSKPNHTSAGSGLSPGQDFDQRGDVRELLERNGWARIGEAGGNERWRRPGKDHGISATLKDGRLFYCFTSSAAGVEGGKAYGPFGLLAALESGGNFHEAHEKLRTLGFGELLGATNNTNTPPDRTYGQAKPSPIILVSASDLLANHPRLRPVVIDGVARSGETVNIVSVSKIGKSWLGYMLLFAVVTGRQWLDRFDCVCGRVLLIDNELHRETLARRLDTVATALRIPDDEWRKSIDIISLRGRMIDLDALQATIDAIKPGTYALVLADAWYRFLPPGIDENSNGDVMHLYNRIDQYADHLGSAWANIHHSSKGDQSGKAVVDVGAGAGSQSRAADTHLILRPHEERDVVVLEAAVRSFPPVAPVSLRWSYPLWHRADDIDPRKLRGTAADDRQQQKDEVGKADILLALAKADGQPMSARQLRSTGLSRERLERLLARLERDGRIVSNETKVKGNTTSLYHIPPDPDDDDEKQTSDKRLFS